MMNVDPKIVLIDRSTRTKRHSSWQISFFLLRAFHHVPPHTFLRVSVSSSTKNIADSCDINVIPDKRTIFLHNEGALIAKLKAWCRLPRLPIITFLLYLPFRKLHWKRHSHRLGQRTTLEAPSPSPNRSGRCIRRVRSRFRLFPFQKVTNGKGGLTRRTSMS